MSLSPAQINKLEPKERRYTVSDGHGLTLKIYPSSTKSWVLRVSSFGKVQDIKLGNYPEVSLAHARQLARRKRKELELSPSRGYTLNDAFKLWKDLKRGRIVSYKAEKRRIEQCLIRYLGNKQLDEISAPQVIHILKPLEKEGKRASVKRLLMRMREMLDYAVCAGYIQHNPLQGVSRVFASPTTRHMLSLPWENLPEILKEVSTGSRRNQQLFLVQLILMLRPGEAVKLKWDWIQGDTLVIPAEEMKKRQKHRIPLPKGIHNLFQIIKKESPHPRSRFVFPSLYNGSKHISNQTLAKYLATTRLKDQLVAHGLRAIARSWMADNKYPFEVSEACLSHVVGSRVSRAYQRSDYLVQREPIMEKWYSYISNCAECAGVLEDLLIKPNS